MAHMSVGLNLWQSQHVQAGHEIPTVRLKRKPIGTNPPPIPPTPLDWVAVKELKLSSHNGYI